MVKITIQYCYLLILKKQLSIEIRKYMVDSNNLNNTLLTN